MSAARPPQSRSEVLAGLKQGVLFALAVLALIAPSAEPVPHAPPPQNYLAAIPPGFHHADFAARSAPADVRFVADWAADSRDSRGSPFVILDKRDARVYVFEADGRLIDESPVLLGAAPGDDPVADIGSRPIAQVRPEEKTTPAGRFISQPGRNSTGEQVVWVDYADSVSMHRVRPVDPKERRLERLASPDPAQRRISYGCINVPVPFFESVVWPTLGTRRAVVYVLPETRDVHQVFASAYAAESKGAAGAVADARL